MFNKYDLVREIDERLNDDRIGMKTAAEVLIELRHVLLPGSADMVARSASWTVKSHMPDSLWLECLTEMDGAVCEIVAEYCAAVENDYYEVDAQQ